jgi:hypothetical protein
MLEVKTSHFYCTQQGGDVSPTPSTCWMEGSFYPGMARLDLLF